MKKLFTICLMFAMVLSSAIFMSACNNEEEGWVNVSNRVELINAIKNDSVNKIKVASGNYGSSEDYLNLVVERPITIKGEGDTKPIIYGSVVIQLADNEVDPAIIENLEISHSGQYVTIEGTRDVDFDKDGRRGVLVRNGSAVIRNNYIHLTEENPESKLYAAPTGIQISVLSSNTVKDRLNYVVKDNVIGVYKSSQTSASSKPTGILAATDVSCNEELKLTKSQLDAIFQNNDFKQGTECFACLYDYTLGKYVAGAFGSEAAAKSFLGEDYSSIPSGSSINQVNGVWVIED